MPRSDKTGVPGENLSVQSGEPINSTLNWRRIWESSPRHIGGRGVLSPLRRPCIPGHSHKLSNITHKLKKSAQPLFLPALSSVTTLPYVKVTVHSDHKQPQPIFEKSLLAA